MSIRVKFFASLRERFALDEITIPARECSAEKIWSIVTNGEPMPSNVLVAINMEYAQWEDLVRDGDEVAFFPPVTGGTQ